MSIYVGNLPYNITEDDLKRAFEEFGEVTRVSVITDNQSGRSKGFAFVEMADNADMDSAITSMDGKDFMGRTLRVNQARPRPKR